MGTAQGVTVILLLNLINFYQDTSLITLLLNLSKRYYIITLEKLLFYNFMF